jgi:SAM-dependent methyltransferase
MPKIVMPAHIRFEHSDGATQRWTALVRSVVDEPLVSEVLDVGGGANPILPAVPNGVRCTLADIDPEELAKAPDAYDKQVVDFSSPVELGRSFDLIISHFVCEHIHSPRIFHENILRHLNPGGRAIHFFPTLYAPPFVINKVLPAWVSDNLLHRFQSDREQEGHHGKFVAYYRWCRGPGKRQLSHFTSVGFEVDEYVGCFGHPRYYDKFPSLERLERKSAEWLVSHPIAWATSYAYLILKRPRTQ